MCMHKQINSVPDFSNTCDIPNSSDLLKTVLGQKILHVFVNLFPSISHINILQISSIPS